VAAQRDQGIDSGGALRWNVAGEQGNQHDQEGNSSERE